MDCCSRSLCGVDPSSLLSSDVRFSRIREALFSLLFGMAGGFGTFFGRGRFNIEPSISLSSFSNSPKSSYCVSFDPGSSGSTDL